MLTIESAFQKISEHVVPLAHETIPLSDAVGRVLAADVSADVDSPPHRKSVMDGFAIRSEDIRPNLQNSSEQSSLLASHRSTGSDVNTDSAQLSEKTGDNGGAAPVRLEVIETIVAGDWPKKRLAAGEAARIMTGAPLPDGADAVVMVELTETETVGEQEFVVIKAGSIPAGKHVMERASNFSNGETVFVAGHRVRPHEIGLLAEIGAAHVAVYKRPTVAILPTGDELVNCDSIPDRGQIRNSNGPLLIALTEALGLNAIDLGIGRDNPADLSEKIRHGLQHDLLILSGGVSAGILDLVPGILQQAGVTEIFHQVKMKPGKPIWFGVLKRPPGSREVKAPAETLAPGFREVGAPAETTDACYVFGLPGNPVSSLVGFQLFVRAAIARMEQCPVWQPLATNALLSKSHETRGDRPTFWPGRWVECNAKADSGSGILQNSFPAVSSSEPLANSAERWIEPLNWQGSSDLRTLALADGLIYFSGEQNQHESGALVSIFPL
jgi:molybdopterin molybdotransferase